MEEEIWKDIPEYEGLYQVSNFGNIKSLVRETRNCKGIFFTKEKILKPAFTCKGNKKYLAVALCKNLKQKTLRIHKLVAMAFLNHTPEGYKLVVDHINNNSLDNSVNNLQLITQRKNTSKSQKNKSSKYTGVCWDKYAKKWKSNIRINGRSKHIGNFTNEHEAFLAYENKLKEIENE